MSLTNYIVFLSIEIILSNIPLTYYYMPNAKLTGGGSEMDRILVRPDVGHFPFTLSIQFGLNDL